MDRLCAVASAEILKVKTSMHEVIVDTLIVGQHFKAWNIGVF
jgi:hypothetical protein